MKIALFGSTGRIGRRILDEALSRGHNVIAVVRDATAMQNQNPKVEYRTGDVLKPESVAVATKGADVVVSAYGPGAGDAAQIVTAAKSLLEGIPRMASRRSDRRRRRGKSRGRARTSNFSILPTSLPLTRSARGAPFGAGGYQSNRRPIGRDVRLRRKSIPAREPGNTVPDAIHCSSTEAARAISRWRISLPPFSTKSRIRNTTEPASPWAISLC